MLRNDFGRDIGMMIHGKLFHDFLQYKFAVMNGQGLNTKDKNSQKDVVGNLMVYLTNGYP